MFITVKENIHIEFDRFYSDVKFNNIEVPEGLRALLETLEDSVICEYNNQAEEIYDEGYQEGNDFGHNEGYHEGHEIGYDEGFSEGRDDGYNEGFDDGYAQCQADTEE
jgi:flagellar biosynthesis/type III secretory pathway protein FliH